MSALPFEAPRATVAPAESRVPALSRLLRGIGAGVLIASASTFLLQHWENSDPLQRYAALLAHTAVLTAVGFFCALRIRDGKGARTLLAVAAGIVPVHFCVLGGLLYSQLGLDGPLAELPRYALWVAPSAGAALATTALAVPVLALVALSAFLALARTRARELGVAYLAANLPMLLPTRDPGVMALLIGLSLASLLWLEGRRFRGDSALCTFEGRLARGMLWTPVVLLVARSVLHYELSAVFHVVVWSGASLLSFRLACEDAVRGRLRTLLRGVAALAAGAASASLALLLHEHGLPEAGLLPAFALPWAGTLALMSCAAGARAHHWRAAAAGIALAATAANLWMHPGVLASLPCLAVAILGLAHAYLTGNRILLGASAGALAFALVRHLAAAVHLYAWSHWGGLALVGVGVIVAAAILERHPERLVEIAAAWRARLGPEED